MSSINQYSKLGLYISPDLYWTDRYRIFIQFNYHYYKTSDNNSFNSNDIYYSQNSSYPYNDFFFNYEVGLIVDNFKLSYNTNFISKNNFFISDVYLPIEPISFLTIDWIFTD